MNIDDFKLKHFVLYTKGWYHLSWHYKTKHKDYLDQYLKPIMYALDKDGYYVNYGLQYHNLELCCNVILNEFDQWNSKYNYVSISRFIKKFSEIMHNYENNYSGNYIKDSYVRERIAIIDTIKSLMRFEKCDNLPKPDYSSKCFVPYGIEKQGLTWKEVNNYVNKYFDKK